MYQKMWLIIVTNDNGNIERFFEDVHDACKFYDGAMSAKCLSDSEINIYIRKAFVPTAKIDEELIPITSLAEFNRDEIVVI